VHKGHRRNGFVVRWRTPRGASDHIRPRLTKLTPEHVAPRGHPVADANVDAVVLDNLPAHCQRIYDAATALTRRAAVSSSWASRITAFHEIVQELGNGIDAADQQMIPCARARDIKQVPFSLIDFL
jgi:hypothetical protein